MVQLVIITMLTVLGDSSTTNQTPKVQGTPEKMGKERFLKPEDKNVYHMAGKLYPLNLKNMVI